MRGHLISISASSAQLVSPFHPSLIVLLGEFQNLCHLLGLAEAIVGAHTFRQKPGKRVSVQLRVWQFRSGRL